MAQLRGNWTACKAREKYQIYHYPLLPENQKRKPDEKLVRW